MTDIQRHHDMSGGITETFQLTDDELQSSLSEETITSLANVFYAYRSPDEILAKAESLPELMRKVRDLGLESGQYMLRSGPKMMGDDPSE